MSTKKMIILTAGAVVISVVLLMFLLFRSLSDSAQDNTGLFKGSDAETRPTPVSQEQLDEEYATREELPVGIMESMPSTVRSHLSAGRFEELDSKLRDWNEVFKDNEDQRDDETAVIEGYRADLAYYFSMADTGEPLSTWYFNNADVLAAVLAFAPVSQKYQAFINRDSALLPPARGDVHLAEAELTRDDRLSIMSDINNTRTESGKFEGIAVYDMEISGYSARAILVRDKASPVWQPYSLTVDDITFDITARLADQILHGAPETDLDSLFAAPDNLYENETPVPSPTVAPTSPTSADVTQSGDE